MKASIVPTNITVFPSQARSVNTLIIETCRAVDTSGRLGYLWQASSLVEVVPATVPPSFTHTPVASGASEITPAQWAAWPAGGTVQTDEAYQLACIAANLGFTIAD